MKSQRPRSSSRNGCSGSQRVLKSGCWILAGLGAPAQAHLSWQLCRQLLLWLAQAA